MTAAPGDWRLAAATEAIARLSTALRPGFGRRSWEEFSTRLARHGPPLFDLVHHLYGWRYDFAWIFEDLVQVAAAGFQARRRALRRADQDLEASLDWLSNPGSLWATAPADPPLERLVTGLADQTDLGISHLHISSPYPPGLRRLARHVRELQIGLVLDLNCHQTNSDHPWAQAATAGDPRFRAFYHIFPDRLRPDRYARHLQDHRAGPGGDSFTWHPDVNGGAWVWTTGHRDRWDLDYANPTVLKAMAAEVLSLANLGAVVIRLEGARFLWKAEGTSCEDLPESHLVVQIMRVLTDLAAPSVLFLAGGGSDEAASFTSMEECRLAYNHVLMSSVWEAQATGDVRLLRVALGQRFELPPGCTWITFLRSDEHLAWEFADDDARQLGIDPLAHRDYLTQFYGGTWPGSYSSGVISRPTPATCPTISGSVAALAGLERAIGAIDPVATDLAVRRILAGLAVIIGAGGIPLLPLRGQGQLWETDDRIDPVEIAALHRGEGPEHRGEGPEEMLRAGVAHLLAVRRRLSGFGPEVVPSPLDPGDLGVAAFCRGPVFVFVNLTGRTTLISRAGLPAGPFYDHVRGEEWEEPVLGPYEYRFVGTNP